MLAASREQLADVRLADEHRVRCLLLLSKMRDPRVEQALLRLGRDKSFWLELLGITRAQQRMSVEESGVGC